MPDDALIAAASSLAAYCADRLAAAGRPVDEYGADLVEPVAVEGDCHSRLAVVVNGASEPPAMHRHLAVGFTVTWTRCLSMQEQRGAAQREADAEPLLRDLWLLWNALTEGKETGSLFAQCERVDFGPAIPVPQLGGAAGWDVIVTVYYPAYNPVAEEA